MEIRYRKEPSKLLPPRKAAVSLFNGTSDKTHCLTLTTNIPLMSKKSRNSAVCSSKSLPILIQNSYQTNPLLNLKKSTKVIPKYETNDASKQNTESSSEASNSFLKYQGNFDLFLNSPLICHVEDPQKNEHTWKFCL